jgi:hypothetical protein
LRDLFDGVVQEGDTVLIYAHFIRSTKMKVVFTLEFDPVDDSFEIQKLTSKIS